MEWRRLALPPPHSLVVVEADTRKKVLRAMGSF
jgi:hypothetical protein